jgi:hypothetical protein
MSVSLRSLTKRAGSGSFSQRYGSADPDPSQNVMDPEHWFCGPDFLIIYGTVHVSKFF